MGRDVKVFSGKYYPKGGDLPEKPVGLDLDRPLREGCGRHPIFATLFLFWGCVMCVFCFWVFSWETGSLMRKNVPSRGYDDAESEAVFLNGCAPREKQGRD